MVWVCAGEFPGSKNVTPSGSEPRSQSPRKQQAGREESEHMDLPLRVSCEVCHGPQNLAVCIGGGCSCDIFGAKVDVVSLLLLLALASFTPRQIQCLPQLFLISSFPSSLPFILLSSTFPPPLKSVRLCHCLSLYCSQLGGCDALRRPRGAVGAGFMHLDTPHAQYSGMRLATRLLHRRRRSL